MSSGYGALPPDLPAPVDDGAADHLPGRRLEALTLPSTRGGSVDLGAIAEGLLVAYLYPQTGVPGRPMPPGWDEIPGARGCTPQSCAYRDRHTELVELGATVVGVSAQTQSEQREFAERERIPFALLSDPGLRLAAQLGLPTFVVEGRRLYRRLTIVAESGRIARVNYPIFPPDRDAGEVLAWIQARNR